MNILKYWQNVGFPIVPIADFPEALVDGFILDMQNHGIAKDELEYSNRHKKTIPFLHRADKKLVELAFRETGRYRSLSGNVVYYCESKKGYSKIRVQRKYYEYFIRVYRKCIFLSTVKGDVVFVKQDGNLVGAIAPLNNAYF